MTIIFNPSAGYSGVNPAKKENNDNNVHVPKHGVMDKKHNISQKSDSVSLTDVSTKLQKLEKSSENYSVVDATRVKSYKLSIDQGNYKIDSNQLAKNLIEFESGLTRK